MLVSPRERQTSKVKKPAFVNMGELKGRQHAALLRMLNLNAANAPPEDQFSDQWKVLVYDSAGRDIISPQLDTTQLRRNGVTLHMLVSEHTLQVKI